MITDCAACEKRENIPSVATWPGHAGLPLGEISWQHDMLGGAQRSA